MATNRTGVGITVDTSQLRRLARELRESAPAAAAALRKELRAGADKVADEVRGRASFSRRIPGSVTVKGSGASLRIVAGGEAAPNAAPIENRGKGYVRHPVFGNREVWTEKNSRPAFMAPAMDARREEVTALVTEAVTHALDVVLGER